MDTRSADIEGGSASNRSMDTAEFLCQMNAIVESIYDPRLYHDIAIAVTNGVLAGSILEHQRLKANALIAGYFGSLAYAADTAQGKAFTVNLIAMVAKVRFADDGQQADATPSVAIGPAKILYDVQALADALDTATPIRITPPPSPLVPSVFDRLLLEAIRYKLGCVVTFFHRFNDRVHRQLARPFLLSPDFAERLYELVRVMIVPRMLSKRAIRVLSTARRWENTSTKDFWTRLSADERHAVIDAWVKSWESIGASVDQRTATGRTATRHSSVNRFLASTSEHGVPYLMPHLQPVHFTMIRTLLTDFEREDLEYHWTALRQIYEQEMDRRFYQDQARTGALRDRMLQDLERLDNRVGEMLILLCYFCFPNITLGFLEKFTHNRGTNIEERAHRLPILSWFLQGDRVRAIASEEEDDVAERRRVVSEFLRGRQPKSEAPSKGMVWQAITK
jgi:hypothetical protein